MIKTIIKRDKTEQSFSAEKLNGWGIWASNNLGHYVSWSDVVLNTVSTLPTKCTSIALQERLIKVCLDMDSYMYSKMAGRLYSSLLDKIIFPNGIPTVQELHKKLFKCKLMIQLNYSNKEYNKIENIIKHSRNLGYTHGQIHQVREKYSLKNRVGKKEYETSQFVYMRMAMALAESQPLETRLSDVKAWYDHFSEGRINCPTPNYVNLGTSQKGYASCCLYSSDDSAKSLAIGDHIAYTMTYMNAGIGSHLNIRSLGDPVKNGIISHQGKLPYYRALVGAVTAQLQNGRGGACTSHYNLFDPEVEVINKLKNPKSTENKKIRGMDYSAGANRFFAKKAAKNEEVFTFNCYTAPDLYELLYSGDSTKFETLYNKYLEDTTFKKNFINAREILLTVLNEAYETGRAYVHFLDAMNSHTPFNETLYLSNLCQEVNIPVIPYTDMQDLYSAEDHGRGEIGLCSLAGLCPSNIKSDSQYESAAYYALLMIDKCIHLTSYALPHLEITAKSRLSAGVGIIGLAHHMAINKKKYSNLEGKQFIHDLAEKHYWFLLKASLKLGKELGNAPWMHKTKWVDGWTPLDTYNKNVDNVIKKSGNDFNWKGLSKEIIENGGIRNSVIVAHMPSEASSKASGLPNGLYPIRDLTLVKTDNTTVINWTAKDGEKLSNYYEIAWNVPTKDLIDMYAIVQKWTDQGISCDLYRKIQGDDIVGSSEMLSDYFYMVKMGLKSRYYQNSMTSEGIQLELKSSCTDGVCDI